MKMSSELTFENFYQRLAKNAPFRAYMAAIALVTLHSMLNNVDLGHVRTVSVSVKKTTSQIVWPRVNSNSFIN